MWHQPPGTDVCITFKFSLMRGRFSDLPLPVDGEVRDVLVHGFFFFQPLDLLLVLFSDLLLDATKNLLMFGRKLLKSRPLDVGSINFTGFRNTGHGNRFIFSVPQRSRQKVCCHRTRANTRKCLNAQRATARCSADAQTGQTGRVYRSDQLSPGRPAAKPSNVAQEETVGADTRRVVLGSAGHLERPQST